MGNNYDSKIDAIKALQYKLEIAWYNWYLMNKTTELLPPWKSPDEYPRISKSWDLCTIKVLLLMSDKKGQPFYTIGYADLDHMEEGDYVWKHPPYSFPRYRVEAWMPIPRHYEEQAL